MSATQYVTTTENALKQLILSSSGAGEWSAPIVPTDQPPLDAAPIYLPDALKEAFANRPDAGC